MMRARMEHAAPGESARVEAVFLVPAHPLLAVQPPARTAVALAMSVKAMLMLTRPAEPAAGFAPTARCRSGSAPAASASAPPPVALQGAATGTRASVLAHRTTRTVAPV